MRLRAYKPIQTRCHMAIKGMPINVYVNEDQERE